MIKSKTDLKEYIRADFANTGEIDSIWKMPIEYFKGNIRAWTKFKFILLLRYFEYCCNNRNSVLGKLRYLIIKHKFEKRQVKTQIFIHENVFGPGLNLVHPGFVWADYSSVVGKNCTILPRVLLGKKSPDVPPPSIIIGDNCYIGTGATILGPCNIGNNVIIAAGSVVTHDVPDNCMVAGVPAVIKKRLLNK